MTRRRRLLAAALAALLIAGGLVWWLVPDRSRWVPTCTDLAPRLQSTAGGTWTVSDPDPDRDLTQGSTICEMAFVTADQQYTGEVHLYAGVIDPLTKRDVSEAPCEGAVQPRAPGDYLAYRACAFATSERVVTTIVAARDDRQTTVRTAVSIRDDAETAAARARGVGQAVTDEVFRVQRS